MVATGALALMGAVFAGASGFSFVQAWGAGGKGRALLQGDEQLRRSARLRDGCRLLNPVARKLLAVPAVRKGARDMAAAMQRRFSSGDGATEAEPPAEGALSWALAAALAAGVAAGFATRSPACGAALGAGLLVAMLQAARADCDRHAEAVREEVPEALRSMGVCFRSGLSLLQTLRQVAHELDGSLGRLFEVAAQRLEMGATTAEALAVMRTARQVPELAFVAVALDAQHQSGGSISAVLEAAQESVESELELRRSLRVQTTQAKLSARIVTLMPFLLVALFSVMSPGFLEPFFGSWAGMALLALALAMDGAGVLLVHRMLKANEE